MHTETVQFLSLMLINTYVAQCSVKKKKVLTAHNWEMLLYLNVLTERK